MTGDPVVPDRPIRVAPRPRDVLSDVLGSVRLSGAVFFDFDLAAPWVRESPPARDIASRVMPGAERVIGYHLIARGGCWAYTMGGEPIRLEEGDLIVYPQGDPHVLASAPGLRQPPDLAAYDQPATFFDEQGGDDAERTRFVCCFLGLDERPYNPLLTALPAVIHLSAAGASTSTAVTLLGLAVREAGGDRPPGAENVLGRLAELIFVETIRRYIDTLSDAQTGWLAGLRDPVIGRALAELHTDPGSPWTVERLGRAVGLSRSMLAERFTAMVGQPPMQYLALWRMQLASHLLRQGGSVAAVARAVGYESEAAFSRAFKKLVGQAPGSWRSGSAEGVKGADPTHPVSRNG